MTTTEPQNPAQVHLDEMRDLAERILALDGSNYLSNREAAADLGTDLAELVRHYDPREMLPTAEELEDRGIDATANPDLCYDRG